MERVGEEQNNLIMAVEKTANEKAEEIETELQTYVSTSQKVGSSRLSDLAAV